MDVITPKIGEPSVIGSYAPREVSYGLVPQVSASVVSCQPLKTAKYDGFATITVQYDGVYILDLGLAQPITSYTLGPRTRFSCPSVSRRHGNDLSTIAVIESSGDMEEQPPGRTVFLWKTSFTDPTAIVADRTVFIVNERIIAAFTPSALPETVLVVFSSGAVSSAPQATFATSPDRTHSPQSSNSKVLRCFLFDGKQCKFSPDEGAVVLVTIQHPGLAEEAVHLHVSVFDAKGNLLEAASLIIPIPLLPDGKLYSKLREVSLAEDGTLSIMTTSLEWMHWKFKIGSSYESAHLVSAMSTWQLRPSNLLHSDWPPKFPFSSEVNIMHLDAVHLILAGLNRSGELLLVLWDLTYQVALSQRTFPFHRWKTAVAVGLVVIQLLSIGPGSILVIISHPPLGGKRKPGEENFPSLILAVSLQVPLLPSLATAMDNGQLSADWLVQSDESLALMTPGECNLIRKMDDAKASNKVYDAKIANAQIASYLTEHTSEVSNAFVRSALKRLLATKGAEMDNLTCMKTLMHRGVVYQSHSDNNRGIVGHLMEHRDWGTIMLALKHVPDISEDVLVFVLRGVFDAHIECGQSTRQSEGTGKETPIQKRSRTDPPDPHEFLYRFLQCPRTPGLLRVAMKAQLRLEHVTALLVCLDSIIEISSRSVWQNRLQLKNTGAQQFTQAVQLAQDALDTFFPTVISHEQALVALQGISNTIDRVIEEEETMEILGGPLESFARAQKKVEMRERLPKRKGMAEVYEKLRDRTTKFREQDANIGLYQIEKLVFQ